MMNYANPYYQPYPNNMMQPQYPTHFAQALQQNYSNTQPQTQQTQQQQQITTQPPIMTPQAFSGSKIIPVSNREEATASPVDLINGTPSFFYNKEKNEVYFKQFDVPTGKGVFKTFIELQPVEEPLSEVKETVRVNPYKEDFTYLKEGIDGLYRVIAEMQCPVYYKENKDAVIDIEPEEVKPKGKKHA